MRMRKRKNLQPRLERMGDILVSDPAARKGSWQTTPQQPVHLEIGCGKGGFITQLAAMHPRIQYVAVERVANVLILAMERAAALGLNNVRFLQIDAAALGTAFTPGEVERIYLNFSDPWPPKKHWKRRLTHHNMLTVFDGILRPGGQLFMKTDNRGLFEYSLCSFSAFGWQLEAVSLNLHDTDIPNVMTEYETNFAAQGMPIYYCRVTKPD